jgi:hypothetical protein
MLLIIHDINEMCKSNVNNPFFLCVVELIWDNNYESYVTLCFNGCIRCVIENGINKEITNYGMLVIELR